MASKTNIPMVSGPHLETHVEREYITCASCGAALNRWDHFKAWLGSAGLSVVAQKYCAGGKEPTEHGGIAEVFTRGTSERLNVCAGVNEPHLHTICRWCGYEWLMKIRGAC